MCSVCSKQASDDGDDSLKGGRHIYDGVLGAGMNWLATLPLSYRAVSPTQTLVATKDQYEKILKLKPKIGGFYHTLADIIEDGEARPFFDSFVLKQHCVENLQFYLEVEDLARVKPFSEAARCDLCGHAHLRRD